MYSRIQALTECQTNLHLAVSALPVTLSSESLMKFPRITLLAAGDRRIAHFSLPGPPAGMHSCFHDLLFSHPLGVTQRDQVDSGAMRQKNYGPVWRYGAPVLLSLGLANRLCMPTGCAGCRGGGPRGSVQGRGRSCRAGGALGSEANPPSCTRGGRRQRSMVYT